jgi:hypothetical protein
MKKRKDPNIYPPGLNAKKVGEIIAYYEARYEADLLEDSDHELLHQPTAWIEVPIDLVPEVKKLLARRKKSA